MDFTFGIITDGENSHFVKSQIDSIKKQKIPNYEIVIVGNYILSNEKNIKVIDFNEYEKHAWITRKKNLIVQNAKYNNIVFSHDYISFDDDWYNGQLMSGENFDIRIDKILNFDGTRYRDWVLWTGDNTEIHNIVGTSAILPYEIDFMIKNQYVSGCYWISKKNIMEEFPLNENLSWGGSEDIEWSKRVREKYDFTINKNSTVKLLKQKDLVFDYMTDDMVVKLKKMYL